MKEKKAYSYDKISGIFIKEVDCLKNPQEEGMYFLSAYTTILIPPEKTDNLFPVFNNNEWKLVPDNRGKIKYHKTNKFQDEIKEVGKLSDEYTLKKPTYFEFDSWDEESKSWVTDQSAKSEYEFNRLIAVGKNKMDQGRKIISLLGILNLGKALSSDDIIKMVNDFALIKNLLETGSLTTARDQILLIETDGTLITESDKTILLDKLDEYLIE